MTTTNPRTQKRTDSTVRPAYILLGVDERSAHQVYDTQTETIHIIHPDGSRGRRLLDGGTVDDYMDAVANAFGWRRRDYGLDFGEIPARQREDAEARA